MKQALVLLLLFSPMALGQAVKPKQAASPSVTRAGRQKRIAELEARVAELEARNAALQAQNEKVAAINKEVATAALELMADTDRLAAAGKNLVQEHERLADRYNQLLRDYNALALQAAAFSEQVRASNAQSRAIRDAAFYNYLASEQQRIQRTFQTYTPPRLMLPTVQPMRPPINCVTRDNGPFGVSTTCN